MRCVSQVRVTVCLLYSLRLCFCSNSVSLPLILDVGSSSLWEIDKCIEYTGVQGVAVSGKDDGDCISCM